MESLRIVYKKKKNLLIPSISDLCNTASAYIFLCLMIYFITMRAIGLHELFALRDFNLVFLLTGILLALTSYSKRNKGKPEYSTGLRMGIRITLTSVIPFAVFIYFYLITDTTFMNLLRTKLNLGEFTGIIGEFITPALAAGIIFAEGILSGIIITFITMQFLKK